MTQCIIFILYHSTLVVVSIVTTLAPQKKNYQFLELLCVLPKLSTRFLIFLSLCFHSQIWLQKLWFTPRYDLRFSAFRSRMYNFCVVLVR